VVTSNQNGLLAPVINLIGGVTGATTRLVSQTLPLVCILVTYWTLQLILSSFFKKIPTVYTQPTLLLIHVAHVAMVRDLLV
jgi:uncharacterized membrane protein YwzB